MCMSSLPNATTRQTQLGFPTVCVCHFFYDDKAMGNHIALSQLDAAAPESSYPLSDNPVSQPALSQTFVGYSVIVVRRVCSLVSNFISRHLQGTSTPALPLIADLRNQRHQRPFIVPLRPGDCLVLRRTQSSDCIQLLIYRPRRDDRLRLASDKSEKLISNQQPLRIKPGSPTW